MNATVSINDLGHEDIRAWLKRALQDQEALPRLSPDESPYLGILRLERELKPAARDSLRDACLRLVREFCADGSGEASYVEELLALTSAFKDPEAVYMLAELAARFPELPRTSAQVRLAVLATLVDTPPPRDMAFWEMMLGQDPQRYAGMTLSGVLGTNPEQAVAMLPRFPDSERLGQAAALKLDLTWDDLPPRERFLFVQDTQAILPRCGRCFGGPVQAWTDSKRRTRAVAASPSLPAGITRILGLESSARTLNSRLSPCPAA
ncbi:MAG: hypothetical protein ABSH34_19635 [Verrucomicrobiota bacterium]|jgi:hypothetical protein